MALLVRDQDDLVTLRDCDLDGVEDGDEETTYTLRVVPPAVYTDIQKRHTKKVINRVTHRREDVVDQEAVTEDLIDYLLVSWTGVIYKRDRSPVPCTRETKLACITGPRMVGLLKAASINEVEAAESRASSFRATEPVGDVVGG
jgi:hypothetical protein